MTSDPLGRHAEHAGFGGVRSDMTFDAERDRPGRVHALERLRPDIRRIMAGLRQTLPVAPTVAEGEDTITAWCRLFARLLHLGLMPFAPWNTGRGSCVYPGNACIDGGFADLLMLVPFESIPDDRWFRRSVLASVRLLGHTVSVFAVSIVGQLLIETTRSRPLPRLRLRPVLHEHP